MGTNTGEVIDAINALTAALGGTPTAPTITLADVTAALGTSNLILAAIRSEQATQATAALSVLNSIDLSLATMLENNAANTKYILAALYATFCGCATGALPLAPPLIVTPTELPPDEKCQRIQFYISVFTSWLSKIATYTAATGGITSDVLGTLLALAATEAGLVASGAEVGSVLGPPGVVVGAIVSLIAGAVYLVGSAFLNDYIVDFNSPIFQSDLLNALYAANSAEEGQVAFENALVPYFSAVPAAILAALWWSQWSNDIYSTTPVIDASAFDSTLCVPPELECYEFVGESVTMHTGSSEATFVGIVWPNDAVFVATDVSGATTATGAIWTTIDIYGWRLRALTGTCTAFLNTDASHALDGSQWTCDVHTTLVSVLNTSNEAFSLEICRPLEL